MVGAERNPYSFEPIATNELFACRDKEICDVKYYIGFCKNETPICYNFLILGAKGSGKTSMLNIIKVLAKENGVMIVDVPLYDIETDISFIKQLFDAIITTGANSDMYGGRNGNIYKQFRRILDNVEYKLELNAPLSFFNIYVASKKGDNPTISLPALKEDFKDIVNEAKTKKITSIALFLDDCDILSDNSKIILTMNRLFENIKGYHLIFAGTKNLITIMRGFEPLMTFELRDLTSKKELEEFVLKPLDENQKRLVDQSVFDQIHKLTHGHASPRLVTLFAHYIYRHFYENLDNQKDFNDKQKMEITNKVLESVLSQIETQCIDSETSEEVKKLIDQCIYWATPKILDEVGAHGAQ